MKVKELIEKLKEFDEDLEVVGMFWDEYGRNINQDIDVFKHTVKETPGIPNYHLTPSKELPSSDIDALIIQV